MALEQDVIQLNLGAARHKLTPREAAILRGWLARTHSLAAENLARAITAELEAERRRFIELGLDHITALRQALADAKVGQNAGLIGLRDALAENAV